MRPQACAGADWWVRPGNSTLYNTTGYGNKTIRSSGVLGASPQQSRHHPLRCLAMIGGRPADASLRHACRTTTGDGLAVVLQNDAYWDRNNSALLFPNSSSSSYGLLTRFWLDGSGAHGAAGRSSRACSSPKRWTHGRALSAKLTLAAAGAQG